MIARKVLMALTAATGIAAHAAGVDKNAALPPPMPAPGAGAASSVASQLPPSPAITAPARVASKVQLDPAALKKSKPGPRTLPGIGQSGSQDKTSLNQQTLRIGTQNEVVYISANLTNRIATPFKDPKVVDLSNADIRVVGQDIYITPSEGSQDSAFGVFIRDGALPQSPVVSLTLVPKNITGQNIILQTEQKFNYEGKSIEAEEIASDYVSQLKAAIRNVVMGGVPVGFAEGELREGIARIGAVVAIPQKIYSGQSLNIFQYQLENVSKDGIELTEQSFYQDGVRAVAFYPSIRLAPNERTMVYIIADKLDDR